MASEDQIILRAFLEDRKDYEKFAPYVIGLKNLERAMKQLLNHIQAFYEAYPNSVKCPESELRLYLKNNDPFNFAGNHSQYITDLYSIDMSNKDLTADIIEACVERHLMSKVVDKAAKVLDNNQTKILSTVQEDIDEFHGIIRNPPQEMVEYKLDLNALINAEIRSIGIPFVNATPNSIIKGMRTGQLGLIYAYVDTGKTSYGVANLCSVAQHLCSIKSSRTAVYACNEEDVSRVSLRAIQCMTNWSDAEIAKNEKLVDAIIRKKGFDHIKFLDHMTDMHLVEKALTKYNPRVMFIDQGTKVRVRGTRREGVDALEEIFNTYRDLAKRHNTTIICMAQGGETCFEKKAPNLRDIYGSKSALQGELDWAIAIGVDVTDKNYADFRYFNITKNKGDKGSYVCRFDPKRCQFKEVV